MKNTAQIEKVVAVRVGRQVTSGKRELFFLFTTGQVEEVLSDIVVRPLPFAPAFLHGVSYWRERLLPVIDLEKRLAIKTGESAGASRFVVVRAGADGGGVFRCVLKLSDEIHSMDISAAEFVAENEQTGAEPLLLRGAYRWNDKTYIVPDLVSILQNQPDTLS